MITKIELAVRQIALFVKVKDFESAIKYCDQAITDNPHAWIFYREKADIFETIKNYEDALIVRESLVTLGSEEPSDYYDLCRLSLYLGNNIEVIHWADEAIRLCNIHDNFYYHDACIFYKSNALVNLKRYKEALAASVLLEDGYGTYIAGVGMKTKEDIIRTSEYYEPK